MAKAALPDFDAAALCEEALRHDIGISISTNSPADFKRKLYTHMARHPEHKLSILTGREPNILLLVRPAAVDPAS